MQSLEIQSTKFKRRSNENIKNETKKRIFKDSLKKILSIVSPKIAFITKFYKKMKLKNKITKKKKKES